MVVVVGWVCVRHIYLCSACHGTQAHTHQYATQLGKVNTSCNMPTQTRSYIRTRIRKLHNWHMRFDGWLCASIYIEEQCVVPCCRRCVRTILRNVAHSTLEEHAANNNTKNIYGATESVALQPTFESQRGWAYRPFSVCCERRRLQFHMVNEQRRCDSAALECDWDGCNWIERKLCKCVEWKPHQNYFE